MSFEPCALPRSAFKAGAVVRRYLIKYLLDYYQLTGLGQNPAGKL
ncbi:hypothetical protein X474_25645 [Dethiosulfatarculus sandiegensis]|uniref:Uncharacterized protein n=1 Tax=Dethiosulfatarculus sandiegensis TaxID=1429043 RepID=A0A0D2J6A2_9BACT|nr:hypothetical protein X474_25645 [Dethiosulfatarculus sandiegensis]